MYSFYLITAGVNVACDCSQSLETIKSSLQLCKPDRSMHVIREHANMMLLTPVQFHMHPLKPLLKLNSDALVNCDKNLQQSHFVCLSKLQNSTLLRGKLLLQIKDQNSVSEAFDSAFIALRCVIVPRAGLKTRNIHVSLGCAFTCKKHWGAYF